MRANTQQATGQPAAKTTSRELPSELQAAPPLSQGSLPGMQAGKQLSNHQELPGAAIDPADAGQHQNRQFYGSDYFLYF